MALCKPVHTAGISMASLWNAWIRMTVACVEIREQCIEYIIIILIIIHNDISYFSSPSTCSDRICVFKNDTDIHD